MPLNDLVASLAPGLSPDALTILAKLVCCLSEGATGTATGATGAPGSPGLPGAPGATGATGAGAGTDADGIIFHPGLPTTPNGPFVATWAEVIARVNAAGGATTVYIDPSGGGPLVVPAGSFLDGRGALTLSPIADTLGNTILTIQDGAVIHDLGAILGTLVLEAAPTTTVPLTFSNGLIFRISDGGGLRLTAGATLPFVQVPDTQVLFFATNRGVILDQSAAPAVPIVDLLGGSPSFGLFATEQLNASSGIVRGSPTANFIFLFDSTIQRPTNSGFTGNRQELSLDFNNAELVYSPGNPGPLGPDTFTSFTILSQMAQQLKGLRLITFDDTYVGSPIPIPAGNYDFRYQGIDGGDTVWRGDPSRIPSIGVALADGVTIQGVSTFQDLAISSANTGTPVIQATPNQHAFYLRGFATVVATGTQPFINDSIPAHNVVIWVDDETSIDPGTAPFFSFSGPNGSNLTVLAEKDAFVQAMTIRIVPGNTHGGRISQASAFISSTQIGGGLVVAFGEQDQYIQHQVSPPNPAVWVGGNPGDVHDAIERIAAALVARTGGVPIP